MPQDRAALTRAKLVQTASELIRRKGFVATRIDDVCELSNVTKGAFFHHFKTKEELAGACLGEWRRSMVAMVAQAPFQKVTDPRKRLLACIDFYIEIFDDPRTLKSCLVGTTVQEVSETHPELRSEAHQCFEGAKGMFKSLLDEAAKKRRKRIDTASLADLWIAAIQGSFILYKASQDAAVIRRNLQHVKKYIAAQL